MNVAFNAANEKKFVELVGRYPYKEAALLPALWMAQEQFGELSLDVQNYVATRLDVSLAKVQGVISFYTLFQPQKKATHHLQMCRNISCVLKGVKKLYPVVEKELGIHPGETSEDKKFCFELVECLGACGNAPAMQVNLEAYHEHLDEEKLSQILRGLKAK